jgi:hypothetical protein
MSVIVVGAEKNFAALRSRLFSGSVSTKVAGQVSAAIQEANPGVDLKALAPGTVLTIPDDLPHVVVHGGISLDDISKKTVTGLVTDGDSTISQLTTDGLAAAKSAATARKALVKSLGGAELTAAASSDKTIAASIQAAQDALAAADAAAAARAAALAQAQTEWSAELAALRATLPTA